VKSNLDDVISGMSRFAEHSELRCLVDRIRSHSLSIDEICVEIRKIGNRHPDIKDDLFNAVSLSVEVIISSWESLRDDSAGRGTYMHQQFEYYLNGGLVDLEGPEMRMFLKFISTLSGWVVYRTEWMIYGDEEWLAGSIDCCLIDSHGSMMLIDWKRSRGLPFKYGGYGRYMKPPLEHIPDCAGWHYRLQLNCYKYILQKYYECAVSQMLVVCTHPEHGSFPFLDRVESLDMEVDAIMSEQRAFAVQYLNAQ
jgi:hypothetical protein